MEIMPDRLMDGFLFVYLNSAIAFCQILYQNAAKRCIKLQPNAASNYSQTLHQITAKRCIKLQPNAAKILKTFGLFNLLLYFCSETNQM